MCTARLAQGAFPVLIAASPYPRQIQDLGAPTAIIEAGNSEFFVSRGYVHVIANLRGTGGSTGQWGFFDEQERRDLYDLVEWAAGQPWSSGNIGMIGISYFAIAQIGAAAERPPHLSAIFPFEVTSDLYEAAYHYGLFSSSFISPWLTMIGVTAPKVIRSGAVTSRTPPGACSASRGCTARSATSTANRPRASSD